MKMKMRKNRNACSVIELFIKFDLHTNICKGVFTGDKL